MIKSTFTTMASKFNKNEIVLHIEQALKPYVTKDLLKETMSMNALRCEKRWARIEQANITNLHKVNGLLMDTERRIIDKFDTKRQVEIWKLTKLFGAGWGSLATGGLSLIGGIVWVRSELREDIQKLDTKIDKLDEKLDRKVDELTAKIDKLDEKLDRKVDELTAKIDKLIQVMAK